MASFVFHGRLFFHISLMVFVLLHNFFGFVSAQSVLYNNCNVTSNYTTPSAYEKNLNTLLSGFSTNITKYGYHSASLGDITAIAFCRGDIELNVCRSCVDDAISNLTQLCPSQKEAVIWYDYCMFRYTDQPVPFGTMVWGPGFEKWNVKLVPDQYLSPFLELRTKLFNNLRDQAASSSIGTLRKYATGGGKLESYQNMYALVQCTPDLSSAECMKCINATIERIPTCCNTSLGGAVYKPTCNIRYELGTSPFYRSLVSDDAPSPAPLPDTQGLPTDSAPPPATALSPPATAAAGPGNDGPGKIAWTGFSGFLLLLVSTVMIS